VRENTAAARARAVELLGQDDVIVMTPDDVARLLALIKEPMDEH
jgi:hypothetical protein